MQGKREKDAREYRVFQKEPYNGIPNVTVWRVLQKREKACMPLNVKVFVTLATVTLTPL
jgi:hypothetical protein